jgi:hypothetical protein
MKEFTVNNETVYCELITILDTPFIFCATQKNIQRAISCVYPVRYYSIEIAINEFIKHKKKYNEN